MTGSEYFRSFGDKVQFYDYLYLLYNASLKEASMFEAIKLFVIIVTIPLWGPIWLICVILDSLDTIWLIIKIVTSPIWVPIWIIGKILEILGVP